ncbi:MAG: ABC transporter substrate-binding protein [Pseudomonadota bacterium]
MFWQQRRAFILATFSAGVLVSSHAAIGQPADSQPGPQPALTLVETPSLASAVKLGNLQPVAKRVPAEPRIVHLKAYGLEPGRHGGRMRWLMGREKDIRMAVYYGYSRLVCYGRTYQIEPDILASFDVQDGRIFTFRLRKGHRWSDGHPVSSEDFRYWWEDVAHHKKLNKGRLPDAMLVKGQPPKFEVIDDLTVRYTWSEPNPSFLPALARTRPIYIMVPSHFLKRFHADYASAHMLKKRVKKARTRNWVGLHKRMSRLHRPLEPDMPTLDPWINTTPPPSTLLVLKRNPYFHRVDNNGLQLPYIDAIDMAIGSTSLIPAKTGAGDSDLQARYLSFDDYTFLKAAEKRGKIKVHLWDRGVGSQIALVPNLTTEDETWRTLFRDVNVRRALSLAINRAEINAAIYYGLARVSSDTVLPQSPLYREAYAKAWASYDPAQANRLLDAAGLERRDFDGIRRLPDGRRAEIIVESAGESNEQADVLSLVKDHFRDIGIALFLRPTQRDLFRKRAVAGQTVMSVWWGKNNAIPGPDMSPARYAPTAESQLQWPAWGHYYETKGMRGIAPDLPAAQKLLELFKAWKHSRTTVERTQIWHDILALTADQVFTIGIVNGAKQPVVTAPNMRNVPEKGVFAFEPGGYFGVYMPDTFWYDQPAAAASPRPKGE